jgi:hypothetical protein
MKQWVISGLFFEIDLDVSVPDAPSTQESQLVSSYNPLSISKKSSTTPTPTQSTSATPTTSRRIVSSASIADPNENSAGGTIVWASNEMATNVFASNFVDYVTSWIWPDGITLDWVEGRTGNTELKWNSSFNPFPKSLILAPKKA